MLEPGRDAVGVVERSAVRGERRVHTASIVVGLSESRGSCYTFSRASRGSRSLRRRRRDPRCRRRHRGYRAGTPPAGELLGGCARDVQGRGAVDLALDQSMRAEALARRDGQPVLVVLVARRLRWTAGPGGSADRTGRRRRNRGARLMRHRARGAAVRRAGGLDALGDVQRSAGSRRERHARRRPADEADDRPGGAAGVCRLTRRGVHRLSPLGPAPRARPARARGAEAPQAGSVAVLHRRLGRHAVRGVRTAAQLHARRQAVRRLPLVRRVPRSPHLERNAPGDSCSKNRPVRG